MRKPLIIAYGNPLRQDDGVAWRAADLIEARLPPEVVSIYRRHQLTPELSWTIYSASLVILLDAAVTGGPEDIALTTISAHRFAAFSHDVQPRQLLALARDLFNVNPPAFLITANVSEFGFDDQLTPHAEHCAVLMAERTIEVLASRGYVFTTEDRRPEATPGNPASPLKPFPRPKHGTLA